MAYRIYYTDEHGVMGKIDCIFENVQEAEYLRDELNKVTRKGINHWIKKERSKNENKKG